MTPAALRRLFGDHNPVLATRVAASPARTAFWEVVEDAFAADLALAENLQRDPARASTREQRLLAAPLTAGETLETRVAVTLVRDCPWESTLAELEAMHPTSRPDAGSGLRLLNS